MGIIIKDIFPIALQIPYYKETVIIDTGGIHSLWTSVSCRENDVYEIILIIKVKGLVIPSITIDDFRIGDLFSWPITIQL